MRPVQTMRGMALIEQVSTINTSQSKQAENDRVATLNDAETSLRHAYELSGKKLAAAEQARALGKAAVPGMRHCAHARVRLLPGGADDEPLAALCPAALEDVATRLCGVALAETVLAVAADLAGLVRALHDCCLLGRNGGA